MANVIGIISSRILLLILILWHIEDASAADPGHPTRSTLSQGSDIETFASKERSGPMSRYRDTAAGSTLIGERRIPNSPNGRRNAPQNEREKKRNQKAMVRFADTENKPLVTVYSFKRDSAPVRYKVNPVPNQLAPVPQAVPSSQRPPLPRHPTAFDMRRQFATYGNPNGRIPLRPTSSQPHLRDSSRSSHNWPGLDHGVGLSRNEWESQVEGYKGGSSYAPRIPQKQPTLRRSKSQSQTKDRSKSIYVPAPVLRDSSKRKSRTKPVLRPSISQPDIRAPSGRSGPSDWSGPGRQTTKPGVQALPGPPLQRQWSQNDIGSRGNIQGDDQKSTQRNSSHFSGILPELKAGIRNLLNRKKSAMF
ncbi:hypothetical protein DdX_10264 [Ditylenchus destructor]|uniref:Uncharacterized protein n=1 Tax=Ditylenchus destructor TaxID=166010 RepID=A0AAD4N4V5_9BILA|nr:hypothetical protein DdX_10264 [Ditylenchus destructor]